MKLDVGRWCNKILKFCFITVGTIKILKFRTSKDFVVITLRVEQDDFSLE